jgi:hypothetical protein
MMMTPMNVIKIPRSMAILSSEHAYRNKYETQKLLHYAEIKTPDSRHSSMPQHPRREPLRVQNPLFDILLPDGQHLLPRVSLNRK